MNNLNSVLLEGVVDEVLKQVDGEETKFTIVSNRHVKTESGYELEQIRTLIVTRGKLAGSINRNLTKDRGVRIVGRIDEIEGKFCIVAEHAEFRPETKKAK